MGTKFDVHEEPMRTASGVRLSEKAARAEIDRQMRDQGGEGHYNDQDEGEMEDRYDYLTAEMERNDKYLEVLREALEVLYDRLTPILTPERPTDDSDGMKASSTIDASPIREHTHRQSLRILSLTARVRGIIERTEV